MTAKPSTEGSASDPLTILRKPFPDHQISLLPKQMKRDDTDRGKCGGRYSADGKDCGGFHARSIHLDYVGHAALTDRLLDADPHWDWEPLAFGPDGLPMLDRNGGLWIKLTVGGVTRLGYGDAQGKTGPNAVKEAIGDALRNAGMRFGAALDLWHKGDLHAAEVERSQEPERAQEPVERKAERGPIPAEQDPWAGHPVAKPPPTESEKGWVTTWETAVAQAKTEGDWKVAWATLKSAERTGVLSPDDAFACQQVWKDAKTQWLETEKLRAEKAA